jgi:hypothetical protein
MYSRVRPSVNAPPQRSGLGRARAPALCLAAVLALPTVCDVAGRVVSSCSCDETLTRLFTPPHPQLGRYEVCTTPEPLASIAPEGWNIQAVEPLDAFGTAGPYNRSDLARLYGGRRARVAHGFVRTRDGFESLVLISPYPDATLTHLMPGTMVIRYLVPPW